MKVAESNHETQQPAWPEVYEQNALGFALSMLLYPSNSQKQPDQPTG
ncbi:hypothetical protein [Zooshikella ganghwensis]|nr:hypothetical protein [Zooshikella ganghwensis]